jgi:pyruvate dehydrogenase E2 component (dihydrolipoamide acetyltransferase)
VQNTENNKADSLPLTRIQKLIGKLMSGAKRSQPSCYMQISMDMTDLVKIRKNFSKETGVRITTNDFFICAMARAAADFPLMTGQLDKDSENIIIAEQIGVGFAVAAPQGLMVPVVKGTGEKTLQQIAIDSDSLLKKARSNKLVPDDFDGASVVLSGLGMYGVDSFYAIAPPKVVGIVSLGTIDDTLIPTDEGIVTRRMMTVGLAVNQLIVNEAYAAMFLKRLADQIENPKQITE